ncbi:MAG: hypothetical protein M5U31_04510 [Acidimicrobiia bacterium]|nr:hypothetical protein [Acidimicrobiia bacterium]
MSDNDIEELGPVDYMVVEFPAGETHFTGGMAAVAGTAAVAVHGVNRRQDRRQGRGPRR